MGLLDFGRYKGKHTPFVLPRSPFIHAPVQNDQLTLETSACTACLHFNYILT